MQVINLAPFNDSVRRHCNQRINSIARLNGPNFFRAPQIQKTTEKVLTPQEIAIKLQGQSSGYINEKLIEYKTLYDRFKTSPELAIKLNLLKTELGINDFEYVKLKKTKLPYMSVEDRLDNTIKLVPYSQFLDVDSDDEMNTSTRQELERMNKYQGESSSSSSRPVSNVLNNIYDPFVRFPNDIGSYLSSVGDEFFDEPEPEQPKKPETNVNVLNTLKEDTYASLDFANQP